jgi:hypothetical protein
MWTHEGSSEKPYSLFSIAAREIFLYCRSHMHRKTCANGASRRNSILGFFSPDWKQRAKQLYAQAARGYILESHE